MHWKEKKRCYFFKVSRKTGYSDFSDFFLVLCAVSLQAGFLRSAVNLEAAGGSPGTVKQLSVDGSTVPLQRF